MIAAVAPGPHASVAPPRPPAGLPAWQLRDAVACGELRVVDVVSAHLDRLDEVQPVLNAAVAVRRAAALAEARELQAALDDGAPPGLLCGVPFTVKDVIATADLPSRCGSAAFADNRQGADAAAVARLRAAGAILIAKTACPEFAFGVTTDNPVEGVTRNPWGAHSAGGSSGGEAALIGAGASALGIGTDYGGSLRWPAQSCGVLAVRPGERRVDGTGQLPERGGRMDGRAGDGGDLDAELSVQRRFQVVGPLARTVRDLALALGVLADDATLVRLASAPAPPASAVGWTVTESSQAVGAGVADAVVAAVARLAEAGIAVVHAPTVLDGLHHAFNALRDTDPLADLRRAVGDRLDLVGPGARRTLDTAPVSLADPGPLWAALDRLRDGVLAQLDRTPVLIVPVAPAAACALDGTATVDGTLLTAFELMAQCRAVSALRLPALSIPVGQAGGLPVSVQVVAGPGREDLVLGIGLLLEQLLGGAQEPPWLSP